MWNQGEIFNSRMRFSYRSARADISGDRWWHPPWVGQSVAEVASILRRRASGSVVYQHLGPHFVWFFGPGSNMKAAPELQDPSNLLGNLSSSFGVIIWRITNRWRWQVSPVTQYPAYLTSPMRHQALLVSPSMSENTSLPAGRALQDHIFNILRSHLQDRQHLPTRSLRLAVHL